MTRGRLSRMRLHMRALKRLLAVAWWIASGMFIVCWCFPSLTAPQRQAHVRRWSGNVLRTLGVDLRLCGELQPGAQLLVANHVSWLDIVALQAVCPQARFVSKSDVRTWPFIGTLVQGAGTLFVERDRPQKARHSVSEIAGVLQGGGTVAVFPEGTTSDGRRVLAFRPSLLQAALHGGTRVQPMALRYSEPGHPLSPNAPYIGDDTFLDSLWRLSCTDALTLTIRVLPAHLPPHDHRRGLASSLQRTISAVLE